MRYHAIYLTLLLALFSLIQNSAILAQNSSPLLYDERVSDFIAERVLDVAHDIGQELIKNNAGSKSQVFSPISVMSVLALLMLGARGKSYMELQKLFQLRNNAELLNAPGTFYTELGYLLEDIQSNESNGFSRVRKNAKWRPSSQRLESSTESLKQFEHITKIANGLFPQVGMSLNPDYLYTVQSIYSATIKPLNFQTQPEQARDYINLWAKKNTMGKIPELITKLPSDNKLIIANTLYFKGFWKSAFNLKLNDKFYPNGHQQPPVDVEMMSNTHRYPFYESAEYDCRIIGFPYKDNRTTMYVIHPNESTPSKLRKLQQLLNASKTEELISKMEEREVTLFFPKMRLSSSFSLKSTLRQLGVVEIFNSGVSDLSLLESESTCDVAPLKLSRAALDRVRLGNLESDRARPSYRKSNISVDEIVHQVYVDINEKGTEAAAATLAYSFKIGDQVDFKVDTPFMFLIRDDPTKVILFYGLINEPQV